MKICSPEGRAFSASIGSTPRPASLEGLRIGFLDNQKAPVDRMMAHLDRRLKEKYSGVSTFSIAKKTIGHPAAPEIIAALRDHCDVVINGLGD